MTKSTSTRKLPFKVKHAFAFFLLHPKKILKMVYAVKNMRLPTIMWIVVTAATLSLFLYILYISPSPHWQTYNELITDKEIAPASKILEVVLKYDSSASPNLAITELTQKNGYTSSPSPDAQAYHIQLLDSNKHILSEQPFSIQDQTPSEAFDPDGSMQGKDSALSNPSFVLTLPWTDTATQIGITDNQGKQVLVSPLSQVHVVDNTPTFQTIRGDELLNPSPQQLNLINFLLPPAHAQGTNSTKMLNIAIIGDGYTDLNKFHTDATNASQTFVQYEPYKTRASQIAFHTVDNTEDLGCITMDECKTTVLQKMNSAGVPFDQVAVLINYPTSNGSESDGRSFALIGNMNEKNMPHRFTHEVGGHGIGKLLDEYVVSQKDGPVDDKVHQLGNGSGPPPGDGNCYAGTPPATAWSTIANSGDYRKGCFYPNWYAPSEGSIMGSSQGPPYPHYFDAVSQCIINRRLDELVGPFEGDAVPPDNCPPPA